MGIVRRVRAKWMARRRELAFEQLEAGRANENPTSPQTDTITGMHYESQRALGRFLNPKAKTKTEWKGD